MDKKYHYMYMLQHILTSKIYIGISSCDCPPEEDTGYMGSGAELKEIDNKLLHKTIITTFTDRGVADAAETLIVNKEFCLRENTFNRKTGGERGVLIDRTRQLEGIAKAKEKGIYKGRKRSIDVHRVNELSDTGMGASKIARELGIGRASVYRAKEEFAKEAESIDRFHKSSQEADDSDKSVNKCESLCIKG